MKKWTLSEILDPSSKWKSDGKWENITLIIFSSEDLKNNEPIQNIKFMLNTFINILKKWSGFKDDYESEYEYNKIKNENLECSEVLKENLDFLMEEIKTLGDLENINKVILSGLNKKINVVMLDFLYEIYPIIQTIEAEV